jgi:alpha-1,3-mannosyltransferase
MSAGLFPILSDIAPFRRLTEQTGAGMVVDFSEPEAATARFLARWRELAADYGNLRQTLMTAAAGFDWQHAARQYSDLYDAVRGTRTRTILGVPVRAWTQAQAVAELDRCFEQKRGTIVAFANAHCLNAASADLRMRATLQNAVVVNDGIGIDLASTLLFGSPFPHNLNGTDFVPDYLQMTRHCCRIYLLGSRPGVAERAANVLAQMLPQHHIVGTHDGYFPRDEDARVAQAVRAAGADIILVAMGNPHQEVWLRENLPATGCRLGFAVGALFDFLSGQAERAPVWVRAARLEWIYRLLCEPVRLWRRYILGNPLFVLRILGQWWSGARC